MATKQIIRTTGTDGKETLSNILDQYSGQPLVYKEVDTYFDGTPMDDSKVIGDGVIYIKKFGKYWVESDFNATGRVNVNNFGVVGDGVTDDTIALQRVFNTKLLKANRVFIPSTAKIMVSDTITVPSGLTGGLIEGESAAMYQRAVINITVPNKPIFRLYSPGITFRNIGFNGVANTEFNSGIVFKMADVPDEGNDSLNNIDGTITNCTFTNLHKGIEVWGRHVSIYDNLFSQMHYGVYVNSLNQTGSFGGSSRAYKIYRNQFHAFDVNHLNETSQVTTNSCIFNVSEVAYAFHITDNHIDTSCSLFKGNLIDSLIGMNQHYQLKSYGFELDKFENSKIVGNNSLQSQNLSPDNTDTTISGVMCKEKAINSQILGNSFGKSANEQIVFTKGSEGCLIDNNYFDGFLEAGGSGRACILVNTAGYASVDLSLNNNLIRYNGTQSVYGVISTTTGETFKFSGNKALGSWNLSNGRMYSILDMGTGDSYIPDKQPIKTSDITLGGESSGTNVRGFTAASPNNPFNQNTWVQTSRSDGTSIISQLAVGATDRLSVRVFNPSTTPNKSWVEFQPIKTGTTAQIPTLPPLGFQYFNTTLGRPVWWNGTSWTEAKPDIPQSSETVSGIIELATQAETNTGTDDTKAITPLKLANKVASTSSKGLVNQSVAVANVIAPDASTLPNSLATDVPEVVTDLNSVITELNALVTEVTEIKAQLNAKLAADRASGQQQS